MKHQCIWLAVLVGIASALPMQSHSPAEELTKLFQDADLGRNSAIENLVINALEDFRQTMVTGTADIPVLDPLYVNHVLVDDSVIPIPGAHLELNDLVVSKLSTFDIEEVSIENTNLLLRRYHADIQLGVPVIDVDVGQYDLFVFFMGFNIFGKGDAKISITKPWIKIDTNVNIRLGWLAMYLNIMDLRFDFGIADIQFGLVGMFNDPSVDDFVNRFMRTLVLELIEFWGDDVSDIISPIVVDVANDILSDINLIDILT